MGSTSHFKMTTAANALLINKHRNKATDPKKAAVTALFYPDQFQNTHLLFIKRKAIDGDVHSNQVGFPGGSKEFSDLDLKQTALRELVEEVGVNINDLKGLIPLSSLYIPPSNFLVQPYIGVCDTDAFQIQESEVSYLIKIPFHVVMNDNFLSTSSIKTSYMEVDDYPVFTYQDEVIWGATAMILSEIRDLLKLLF